MLKLHFPTQGYLFSVIADPLGFHCPKSPVLYIPKIVESFIRPISRMLTSFCQLHLQLHISLLFQF